MREYWAGLQARERLILVGGGVLATLLLLYALIIDPMQKEMGRLTQGVDEQRKVLAWMHQAAAQIKQMRSRGEAPSRPAGQSLLSLVDGSARSAGLAQALKRVQPDGEDTVKLWFEQVPFDDLLGWMNQINASYGLNISELVVERDTQEGTVRARLSISEGGA